MRVICLARVDIKFKIQTIMSVLRDVAEEIKLVVKFNEFSESYGFNPWLVKWRKIYASSMERYAFLFADKYYYYFYLGNLICSYLVALKLNSKA